MRHRLRRTAEEKVFLKYKGSKHEEVAQSDIEGKTESGEREKTHAQVDEEIFECGGNKQAENDTFLGDDDDLVDAFVGDGHSNLAFESLLDAAMNEATHNVDAVAEEADRNTQRLEDILKENEVYKIVIRNIVTDKCYLQHSHSVPASVGFDKQHSTFALQIQENEAIINELNEVVGNLKKKEQTFEAAIQGCKETMQNLEKENAELVDQINELSVHLITQKYQTANIAGEDDGGKTKKGQTSMVRNIKKRDRKRNRDAEFEYSGKKRGKKQIVTSDIISPKTNLSGDKCGSTVEIVDDDDSKEKLTTIQGLTDKDIKKMWRECEALDAIDFNKLTTIYNEEGYG